MKNLGLVILSVILAVSASPLGDRVVFRRHSSVPVSRRYVLESRTTPPPACAAMVPSGTASSVDPSSTDIPVADPTTTTTPDDSTDPTLAGNSTAPADPTLAGNSTAPADPSLAGNTTVTDPTATDNSTAATNSTATRRSTRFWARDHSFGESSFGHESDFGFDDFDHFAEHDSVAISFEESVSTFVETWETLCLSSGGDIFTNDPCTTLGGFGGIDALLETADPCDQQVIADSMITFAKSDGINNRDDLINFALSYRRHARNAVHILDVLPSSLYCLDTPVNSELVGVYNEQLEGCDPGLFGSPTTAMVPFGSSGTCPLGMDADVDSCGCISSDGSDDSDDTDGSIDSTGDDSTDGTDDSTDGTDDSTDSTDDSSDSTDDSADSTDDSADSTDDSTDSSDSTDATATDSADASAATGASSTDTADASASTDATATDSTAASATLSSGPNVQPTDISGDVNDPQGRR